jgi:3-hydroxybutyryl-CoA dehydrogenase
MKQVVAVIGAGTMGAGIAQIAAVAGHQVLLFDAQPGAADRAVISVTERVEGLIAKGRITLESGALDLKAAGSIEDLADASVIAEAIIEDLAIKQGLFTQLEAVIATDALIASNTSSLSITALGAKLQHPERVVGLHFFNPVPLMRLVEVVPGLATSPSAVTTVTELAKSWGKTVVLAQSTPGFIVNRVARPFYAESWRLYEEQAADAATLDAIMTTAGGFRMGPFALMDLIGHDTNEAVTRSVWAALGYDPRFAPALAQRALVEAGWYGRKTGRGMYDHKAEAIAQATPLTASPSGPNEVIEHGAAGFGDLLGRAGVAVTAGADGTDLLELPSGALLVRCLGTSATELAARHGAPVIVADRTFDDLTATGIAIAASDGCPQNAVNEAVGLLQGAGLAVYQIDDAPGLVVSRTVAMLVNVAVDAIHQGVATGADIDTAMKLGVNYPVGPLEWSQRWGVTTVLAILDALASYYQDNHYRASTLLRRAAVSGRSFV